MVKNSKARSVCLLCTSYSISPPPSKPLGSHLAGIKIPSN
nr:MAG TPA: hypothetical protein [Caudoviricetes sp.]